MSFLYGIYITLTLATCSYISYIALLKTFAPIPFISFIHELGKINSNFLQDFDTNEFLLNKMLGRNVRMYP